MLRKFLIEIKDKKSKQKYKELIKENFNLEHTEDFIKFAVKTFAIDNLECRDLFTTNNINKNNLIIERVLEII